MTEENTGAADSPDAICSAAETLHRAKAEFEKAGRSTRRSASRPPSGSRPCVGTTVGDVIDCSLRTAKRHPVAGLTIAALLGFWLGRLFRR